MRMRRRRSGREQGQAAEMFDKMIIGCGRKPRKGYLNTDIVRLPGVDMVLDLDKFPYRLRSGQFEEIIARNVLEHVKDLPRTMRELHRVMKKGGRLIVTVPHFTYCAAFTDPTHRSFFGYFTFDFFVRGGAEHDFYFDFAFRRIKDRRITFGKRYALWNYLIEPFANRFPHAYENTPLRQFPAEELQLVLIK